MTEKFNFAPYFKAVLILIVGTLLSAQTTLTLPSGDKKTPAGFKAKRQSDGGYLLMAPLIEPKSLKKDRCDEKPRPADCDVKF